MKSPSFRFSLRSSLRSSFRFSLRPYERYERIGRGYAEQRRTDPRIASAIRGAIGDAATVLDIGSGTGNYEPVGCQVIALEPSATMIEQRPPTGAPCVRGIAEQLPFANASFDATLTVLSVHHWNDPAAGLAEMVRVSERQVVFYFESAFTDEAWIMEYWPEIVGLPTERDPPGEALFRQHLDVREIIAIPVPRDCSDGFAGAYWARPECYLDGSVRRAMSCFAQLGRGAVERGSDRLRRDLRSGAWDARHGYLRDLTERDLGYRLLVAGRR